LDQGLFISLINPALSAVLSTAFLVLWLVRRERRYVLQFSVSHGLIAFGFVLQGFQMGLGFELSKLVSNVLFFVAVILFIGAVVTRQGLRVPYVSLLASSVAGMAVFAWFLLVEPDFVIRVFAVNGALGVMCVAGVLRLRQAVNPAPIDRLLLWLAGLRALDFFLRPAAVALFDPGTVGQVSFTTSAYWLTTSLSVIVSSLAIALTLLTAVAIDIMQELRTESRTDALSGLLNRRGLAEKAKPFFEPTRSGGVPLGLVLADLDRFKAVNDTHGHATGDAVIVTFAELLKQAGAGRAAVARTGGEEFAILMPYCDLAAARLLAEGLRTALSGGALDGVKPGLGRITCSFGVTARAGDESFDMLLERADAALLQAKRAGRDRVRVAYLHPEFTTPETFQSPVGRAG
jgi:diguanylate cyclase (GGDEF)-like protein